jgi:microsomal prostaglandin-E synthase 2
MVDGQEVVESNAIVFMLHDLIADKKDSAASARLQGLLTEDTAQWAEWSEARLAVMLYPNITRNFQESWEAFDYCKGVESWTVVDRYTNRFFGPVAMYFANGKVKKKHGIVHEREELAAVCSEWTAAVGKTANAGPFLHGAKVTMPDLMVFGVLKAIAGLPTFSDVMTQDRQLMAWYVAVSDAIAGN